MVMVAVNADVDVTAAETVQGRTVPKLLVQAKSFKIASSRHQSHRDLSVQQKIFHHSNNILDLEAHWHCNAGFFKQEPFPSTRHRGRLVLVPPFLVSNGETDPAQVSQLSSATIVFRGPTSPSRPGPHFGRLVRPGQVSVGLGPHTGTYRGLAATRSRHSVAVEVFMPKVGLKISCRGAVMPWNK